MKTSTALRWILLACASATVGQANAQDAASTLSFNAGVVSDYQCMLVRPKAKRKHRAKPRFAKCASPKRYKKLRKGRYTFKVRARNALGTEAKPAVRKFRVRR